MMIIQKKIWICLMGVSILSMFRFNYAFANESKISSLNISKITFVR